MACADRFDTVWEKHMTPDERREILRQYIRDIRVDHSADSVNATIGLYIIPLAITQQNPVKIPLQAIYTELNCGPQLNLDGNRTST
jgi:hypothetical protein